MIRHVIRGIAIAAGAAAVPLALAVPGSAEIVWGDNHIGNQAGAPTAVGDPFGYTTNLTGQGPAARAVYRAVGGHIEELSLLIPNQGWRAADLTALTDAPAAASAPFGFTTTLTGQDPAARVVYRTASGHIEELASSGGSWSAVDLTALTGAPTAAGTPSGGAWQADDLTAVSGAPDTASAPFGYTTSLTGQVPAARVVYRAAGNDIEELSAG